MATFDVPLLLCQRTERAQRDVKSVLPSWWLVRREQRASQTRSFSSPEDRDRREPAWDPSRPKRSVSFANAATSC
jgi:hypothetical protein